MTFRRVQRPRLEEMVELPNKAMLANVFVPSIRIFEDEIRFWNNQKKTADREGDAVVWRIAKDTVGDLRHAALGRFTMAEMSLGHQPSDPARIGRWFMHSVSTMAQSRLMRELFDAIDTAGDPAHIAFTANANIGTDYDVSDLGRSGIHAKPAFVRKVLQVEPPQRNETCYYEGESIYLRATAPANPTDSFLEGFQESFGEPFDKSAFVSMVPRLKTSFWMAEE